jgi:hypothetical protein
LKKPLFIEVIAHVGECVCNQTSHAKRYKKVMNIFFVGNRECKKNDKVKYVKTKNNLSYVDQNLVIKYAFVIFLNEIEDHKHE